MKLYVSPLQTKALYVQLSMLISLVFVSRIIFHYWCRVQTTKATSASHYTRILNTTATVIMSNLKTKQMADAVYISFFGLITNIQYTNGLLSRGMCIQ